MQQIKHWVLSDLNILCTFLFFDLKVYETIFFIYFVKWDFSLSLFFPSFFVLNDCMGAGLPPFFYVFFPVFIFFVFYHLLVSTLRKKKAETKVHNLQPTKEKCPGTNIICVVFVCMWHQVTSRIKRFVFKENGTSGSSPINLITKSRVLLK